MKIVRIRKNSNETYGLVQDNKVATKAIKIIILIIVVYIIVENYYGLNQLLNKQLKTMRKNMELKLK